jgi:hypothetical protein
MLHTGIDHNLPELGIVNKLIALIALVERPSDEKLRFSFDSITFATGPARQKPEFRNSSRTLHKSLKCSREWLSSL